MRAKLIKKDLHFISALGDLKQNGTFVLKLDHDAILQLALAIISLEHDVNDKRYSAVIDVLIHVELKRGVGGVYRDLASDLLDLDFSNELSTLKSFYE